MTHYRTWQEHYRLAEKLLGDEQYAANNQKSTKRDQAFRDIAQIHATLATVKVDQEQVDQWHAEDEAHFASLKATASARRLHRTALGSACGECHVERGATHLQSCSVWAEAEQIH